LAAIADINRLGIVRILGAALPTTRELSVSLETITSDEANSNVVDQRWAAVAIYHAPLPNC